MPLDILRLDALDDNYFWLLRCQETGDTAVIDPGHAGVVFDACRDRGWSLTHCLLTHHHWDHTDGVAALAEAFGCTVIGSAADAHRLPSLSRTVSGGDTVRFGNSTAQVMAVPGHTTGHIAYWFPEDRALFCGDTLFALGCGRMFEGTPEQFWTSLLSLRALPDDTRVYCAHEYTLSNWRFAQSLDPDNAALASLGKTLHHLRSNGEATVPTLLAEEKRFNPFLRADDPAVQASVGLSGQSPVEVFAELRSRKNTFRG